MTTDAQIAANRANAQHSTGPATEQGKEISRQNAIRHGLTAQQLVALDEAGEDFMRYNEQLREALQPQDAYEDTLVARIVLLGWRLDRVGRIEAAMLNAEDARITQYHAPPRGSKHHVAIWPDRMPNLDRHETSLDRAYQRAMAMLERRQAARRRRLARLQPLESPP